MAPPQIPIEQMPAQFCRDRCNAWNKVKERCNSRRETAYCDHPDREKAVRYIGAKRKR